MPRQSINLNKPISNKLYYGDCLRILKRLHKQVGECIDLVYIDPPFNTRKEWQIKGSEGKAYSDYWKHQEYEKDLRKIGTLSKDLLKAIKSIAWDKNDLAYLTYMGIRIYYIHRVLKKTGSFYLHCAPNMSHYLKILCDTIFSKTNFKNEIVVERATASTGGKGIANKFPSNHEYILYYTKSPKAIFNKLYYPYSSQYLKRRFRLDDKDGKGPYRWQPLIKYSTKRLQELKKTSRLRKGETTKYYEFKQYLSESKGIRIPDLWSSDDIAPLHSRDKRRNNYPGQKNMQLLERVILSSSNPGDIVADFFCGTGTTLVTANTLNRKWMGVDNSKQAIIIAKNSLTTAGNFNIA